MAEKFYYTCEDPTTLLFSSITQKSAPRGVPNAEPKFSGTFGITQKDLTNCIELQVKAISSECGGFSNPNDYYLAAMPSKMAQDRVIQAAQFAARGKTPDEVFKIREKAEKRAALYANYAGILTASSKFDIELARLEGGRIIDIVEEHLRAKAGKDLFYPGAIVAPAIALQGFKRKNMDSKDGVTSFLQNVVFLRKGPKIDTGGGRSNSDVFGGFAGGGFSDYDPTNMAPGGGSAEGWGNDSSQQGQGGHQQQNGNGGGWDNSGQQGNQQGNGNWNGNGGNNQGSGQNSNQGQNSVNSGTDQWSGQGSTQGNGGNNWNNGQNAQNGASHSNGDWNGNQGGNGSGFTQQGSGSGTQSHGNDGWNNQNGGQQQNNQGGWNDL